MPVRLLVGVPEHPWIEKRENIAKRDILGFRDFSERAQSLNKNTPITSHARYKQFNI